ncbi:tripartite motif-containing protein 16 [Chanos chanos]|uniref:Tripartite motif-containing protein 16 n=1 Tax=Chanos chanos TaxID=29144 RepID=A0A6J2VFA7_CHACN|nr:tripartite motif-containing protein 16-like [Chanos chanos]
METGELPSSTHSLTGTGGVQCDACTGRKRKAEQSCLQCVASYCEAHLQLHNTLHAAKRHKLIEATEKLQEKICPDHGKFLDVYCGTDGQNICHLCITDKQRGHDVVTADSDRNERQNEVGIMQRNIQMRLEAREKEVEELRLAVGSFKTSAHKTMEESETLFTKLIQSLKRRRAKVTEMIRSREEAAVRQAEGLIKELEQEISELRKRAFDLEQLRVLSGSGEAAHFLQSFSSIDVLPAQREAPVFVVHPYCSFELTSEAVSELRKKLKITYQWCFITISERVRHTGIVSLPTPRTRAEFLQCKFHLTVNPNTIHNLLRLSKEDRQVTHAKEHESYPDHPERFERRAQMLCKEGLRGPPCYCEVEFGGGSWISIAVCYKGMNRKGKRAPLFGRSHDSWCLRCYRGLYHVSFWHNNKETNVSMPSRYPRIGVYLDHRAGILMFISVSDTVKVIHKVQTKFTEPLYLGFGFAGIGSHVQLCN